MDYIALEPLRAASKLEVNLWRIASAKLYVFTCPYNL